MTAIVERPATALSAWAERLNPREREAVSSPEDARAALVQHALSTTHELALGALTAVSESRGLLGAGGDLVDLIESEGHIVAVLGDVSGKGAAASLVAAVVLSSVQHHVAHRGPHPGAVLAEVDASVRGMLDRTGALVTLVIVAIDQRTSSVRIASAGHHPVMLATPTGTTRPTPACPPLGADTPCGNELTLPFDQGSVLVLASDGLTEQYDAYGAEFGLERLGALATAARHTTPRAALARLFAAVDAHAGSAPATDDRAAIVITAGVDG